MIHTYHCALFVLHELMFLLLRSSLFMCMKWHSVDLLCTLRGTWVEIVEFLERSKWISCEHGAKVSYVTVWRHVSMACPTRSCSAKHINMYGKRILSTRACSSCWPRNWKMERRKSLSKTFWRWWGAQPPANTIESVGPRGPRVTIFLPWERGAAMAWPGCVGINLSLNHKYLPAGCGCLRDGMASVANLEFPGFGASPGMRWPRQHFCWSLLQMSATRPMAGVLVDLSAWPSFYDAGEHRHLPAADEVLAWLAARAWRLLFFRPSTPAASLPRLCCLPTRYRWFTSICDGHGPLTDLNADGAWPSLNDRMPEERQLQIWLKSDWRRKSTVPSTACWWQSSSSNSLAAGAPKGCLQPPRPGWGNVKTAKQQQQQQQQCTIVLVVFVYYMNVTHKGGLFDVPAVDV